MGRRDKPVNEEDVLKLPPEARARRLLGLRMRRARQERGISLTEMARRLAYTKGHLSGVEQGIGRPSRELIEGYERGLVLGPGELTRPEDGSELLIPFGRRRSPISEDIWELLGRYGAEEEPAAMWAEIKALVEEIARTTDIPADEQRMAAGFLRAGLLWLKRQEAG